MNRIHRKSAIGQTTNILLTTHDQGEKLLWGRYEEQLPLCAFTDNGLSCRKCFHGPCRINPFGDEPTRGVCGADRDQIVMENLFQATLDGVLETSRASALLDEKLTAQELPDLAPDLPPETRRRLSEKGILPVQNHQLQEVQNSYFSHKSYLPRTLKDLTRLGVLHYGILKRMERKLEFLGREVPSFEPEGINILIAGQSPLPDLGNLLGRPNQRLKGAKVNLLLQGSKATPGYVAMADHGSLELALAMNLDALIVAPDASFPALETLAEKIGLPVILIDGTRPLDQVAQEALDLASRHHLKKSYFTPALLHPTFQKVPNPIYGRGKEILASLAAGHTQWILVILGETNVKQTFFERTLALMEYGLNQNLIVLVGGELAAQADLLNEELTRRSGGKLPTPSLSYLGSLYEIPRLVAFLKDLNPGKSFDRIPAVITFPEFFRTSTWAAAVSFLSLGFAVQIGTRLPFWGSPALAEIFLKEWPKISGGALLASPSLADSQTQTQEIGNFLKTRNSQR
ncbi:MAG: hypothetical protein ABSF48_07960 [Thermodesulfobacteriota bacterium]